MDRAFVGDFQEAVALLATQRTDQPQRSIDTFNQRILVLAVGTVLVLDPVVAKAHFRAFERPTFAPGVHLHSHRRASPEGHEQQLIGPRACVATADFGGLIRG